MAGVPSATNEPAEPTQFVSVAVIGGGVAGLAAAGALAASSSSSLSSNDQKTVLLLEARDELGGRVRQLRGLAPWPVEMGPEFVPGERSSVVVSRSFCSFFFETWVRKHSSSLTRQPFPTRPSTPHFQNSKSSATPGAPSASTSGQTAGSSTTSACYGEQRRTRQLLLPLLLPLLPPRGTETCRSSRTSSPPSQKKK